MLFIYWVICCKYLIRIRLNFLTCTWRLKSSNFHSIMTIWQIKHWFSSIFIPEYSPLKKSWINLLIIKSNCMKYWLNIQLNATPKWILMIISYSAKELSIFNINLINFKMVQSLWKIFFFIFLNWNPNIEKNSITSHFFHFIWTFSICEITLNIGLNFIKNFYWKFVNFMTNFLHRDKRFFHTEKTSQ